LTFEGGLRVISEKNLAGKYQGKKYPALKKMSLMAYNAWKKLCTVI